MSRINSERRIDYAGSVHDEREIEAVVEVLRGGPTSMRIGKNVKAMERRVADLFEKKRGVMCNSGSSALYLAYEAIDLQPGDEIVTSAVTFSTDVAPVRVNVHGFGTSPEASSKAGAFWFCLSIQASLPVIHCFIQFTSSAYVLPIYQFGQTY